MFDMEYWATVKKEGQEWSIVFPAAPGCATMAETEDEILPMASEAIQGWLESWLETGEVPPRPKRQQKDGLCVPINPALAIAIELRRAREDRGLTQAEVARRAGVSQQQVARLEKPGQNPSVETLVKIGKALGVRPVVTFEPVDV